MNIIERHLIEEKQHLNDLLKICFSYMHLLPPEAAERYRVEMAAARENNPHERHMREMKEHLDRRLRPVPTNPLTTQELDARV